MIRIKSSFFLLCALIFILSSSCSFAQSEADPQLAPASGFSYKNVETNEGTISLPQFGLSVNAYSGMPQLKTKIMSLPGNNAIPMEAWVHNDNFYRENITKGNNFYPQGAVELPRISGGVICSYGETSVVGSVSGYGIDLNGNYFEEFDSPGRHMGTYIHLPGKNPIRLSPTHVDRSGYDRYRQGRIIAHSFGDDADYGSVENYKAICHAFPSDPDQIEDIHLSMDVKSPEGLTYTFEVDPGHGSFEIGRGALRVKRISDVFGNYVDYDYTYNNSAGEYGVEIRSNDGRVIEILRNTTRTKILANDREWRVGNFESLNNESVSFKITNPDGLHKKIEFSGFLKRGLENLNAGHSLSDAYCDRDKAKIRITDFNGALVEASLQYKALWSPGEALVKVIRGPVSATGRVNYDIRREFKIPQNGCDFVREGHASLADRMSVAPAVTSIKLISSTNISEWKIDYEEGWGRSLSTPGYFELNRSITYPDGSSGQYEFDSDARKNPGTLISASIFDINEKLMSVYKPEYEFTNLRLAVTGIDLNIFTRDRAQFIFEPNRGPQQNQFRLLKNLAKSVLEVDGNIYTTEYKYNTDISLDDFSYGYPVEKKTYSNFSPTPRIVQTTYEHNRENWILGLVKTQSINGVEESSKLYNEFGANISLSTYGSVPKEFSYRSDGTLEWSEDELDRRTEFLDWKRGTPQQIKRPDNRSEYQYVDDNGWLTSKTDAEGQVTSYRHDSMGRLTQIDPPGNYFSKTEIDYDFTNPGAVQTITRGDAVTRITYDSMLRPVLETSELNGTAVSHVNTQYDALGRTIFTSFPSTSTTEFNGTSTLYDALNRPVETRVNGETVSTTRYRTWHRRLVTDAKGELTTYINNAHGELIEIRQPMGIRTRITRDSFGKPTRIRQDGTSNGYAVDQSQFLYYNSEQRLCRHHVPEGGSTLYKYDAAGQVVERSTGMPNGTDCAAPSGESLALTTYTALGQVDLVRHVNSPSTNFFNYDYDANGNMTLAQRYRGATGYVLQTYGFNELNLPTTGRTRVEANANDNTPRLDFLTDREYTPEGHLSRRMHPGGRWIDLNPDDLGRMGNVSADGVGNLATNTSYHPNGAVNAFAFGSGGGQFVQWLDSRQRPLNLRHERAGGARVVDLTYGYDANSRITSQTDALKAARTRTFTYDAAGRLTQAVAADPLHGQIDYSYDALGNLRQKSYTFGQYDGRNIRLDYAANNRLHWVHDKDLSGTYAWTKRRWVGADSRGNTAHYGNLHAVYDMTDQPVQMFGRGTGSNGSEWAPFGSQTHLYDGHKRRVKTVSAWGNGTVYNVRYNIFDAAGTLVQVYDATKDERTDYIPGPNGALARIKRKAGTDSVTFIHADHLGTARAGTSATGARLFEDFHTPFGESLIHPDATDDQGDYTGHIRDRQTGLSYMQARYQDPLIGRFLSVDPMDFMSTGNPAMFNRYAYTFNDPINMLDPDGENPLVHTFVRVNAQAAYRDPGSYATGLARGAPRAVTGLVDAGLQSTPGLGNSARGLASVGHSATGAYNDAIGLAANSSMAIGEFTGELAADSVGGGAGVAKSFAKSVAKRLVTSDGALNVSKTVAKQLDGTRSYIPSQSIIQTVESGARVADPKGVAGRYMYTAGASRNGGSGTLEVLVNEKDDVIEHVLYKSD